MSPGAVSLTLFVLLFVIVIAVATIRTKARQRRIRKVLGLPAKMRTSTAEAQARNAVRVFEETSSRLTTTGAGHLSREERQKMARAIVEERGLLPKERRGKAR